MPTEVINVRGKNHVEFLSDPRFIYVGRACAGWPRSIWGNPLRPETRSLYSVQACVVEFAHRLDHIRRMMYTSETHSDPDVRAACVLTPEWDGVWGVMVRRIDELHGKRLGCWCVEWDGVAEPPLTCHTVVLALAAEGRWDEVRKIADTFRRDNFK